ncbi:MAG: hypothetical protein ACPH3N_12810 [Alcanivorax sediminis]|uniref:hypothetical protein n=1 Tax=Alcanivorax sediminis TaxID=2663008 RepID=UPI003C662BBD
MRFTIKAMLVMSLGGVLVACGGGGSSSSSSRSSDGPAPDLTSTFSENVTVTPSLGKITNATVKIYDANYKAVIGEGALDENGKAVIQVTYSKLEPMIVELTAGEGSTYFDEAAGLMTLPAGSKLHAITSDPRSTAVTPLTELAWQLAKSHGSFPLDEERVENINSTVSHLFTGGGLDINYFPVILSEMPATNSQTGSPANLYAAILGALAKVGDKKASPALAVLEDLSVDAVDGILNDVGSTYLYSDFATEFRQELENWAATYGNKFAREDVASLPLPGTTLNYRANIPVRERLASMEYGVGSEVAASRDSDSVYDSWALFPEGNMFSFHREGSVIGIAAGDNGLDPDAGVFIEGWSVDINTASYENLLGDLGAKGIRVELPTGDPDMVRYMMFVSRDGLDFDDLILIEDDLTTAGPRADRLAHILAYESFDFMQPDVQAFFNDVHAMVGNGDSLTVVQDTFVSKKCTSASIGSNDSQRYPKVIGLHYADNTSSSESIEPQRVRYAEADDQREILFEGRTLFRINDATGRVDFIKFNSYGSVSLWVTNDSDMIANYCS